jgi:LysR family transcriptional activator of nhaA
VPQWKNGKRTVENVQKPWAENVSPLDLFPAPWMTETTDHGYIIRRMKVHPGELEGFKGVPGWQTEGIDAVIAENSAVFNTHAIQGDSERAKQEGKDQINDKRGDRVTHLQIGALDSVPKAIIEQLLAAANRVSECYVSLLEGPTDFLLRELMAHRIDLVITNTPAPIAPKTQCHSRLIAEMPVVVFGAREFHKLKQGFPKSLEAQPFVLPTTHSKLRSDIENFFDTKKIKIRPIIETQDTSLQQLIVQSGKALAAMAEPAFTSLGGENKLAILGQLPVKEQLWLSSASRRIKNPIASELMENFKLN